MTRTLTANAQCEHVDRRLIDGAYTLVECHVRHLARVDGKPQHLIPVKDGRVTRFMCMQHAPLYRRDASVYRKPKGKPPAEQINLFGGQGEMV